MTGGFSPGKTPAPVVSGPVRGGDELGDGDGATDDSVEVNDGDGEGSPLAPLVHATNSPASNTPTGNNQPIRDRTRRH